MDTCRQTAIVANGGTTADFPNIPGMVLVGLILPTLTSTTLAASLYMGSPASALVAYDAAGAAIVVGGSAHAGSRYVEVPQALQRMSAGVDGVRFTVAAQGAERSIVGIYMNGGGA